MVVRSLTFAFEQSRLAKRTPSPQDAFDASSATIASWLAAYAPQLKWPTLDEVQAVRAELFGDA